MKDKRRDGRNRSQQSTIIMRDLQSIIAKSTLAFGLAIFSLGAQADCGGAPGFGTCENVKITLLYIDANADAWLSVSGNIAAAPCTPTGDLIQLPRSSANFKEVYATLLAAHMAERIVNVRLASGTQCAVAYVTVS